MDLQTAELLSGRHWQVAKFGAFAFFVCAAVLLLSQLASATPSAAFG
jgi:hypothetical protein